MFALTPFQREILVAVVSAYQVSGEPVKSTEISERVNAHPGSIRNALLTLRAIGFIESKKGPRGGYIPTAKAFEYYNKTYKSILICNQIECYSTILQGLMLFQFGELLATLYDIKTMPRVQQNDNVTIVVDNVIFEGTIVKYDKKNRNMEIKVRKAIHVNRITSHTINPDTPIIQVLKYMIETCSKCLYIHGYENTGGLVIFSDILDYIANNGSILNSIRILLRPIKKYNGTTSRRALELGICID